MSNEIRQFCSAHHVRLNTDIGQHFLIDEDVLASIIEAAHIEPTDHVVEIGPGIGVLTRELLKHAGNVTAIELDERLIPLIREFTMNHEPLTMNQFTVIHNNALTASFPNTPYKIVANIPYHITSPLLRHAFLESPVSPTTMTLLIQREVAEKICTDHNRSMLTIIVQLFGKPHIVRNVPPTSFLPPPKVDSSILHIDCFPQPKAKPDILEAIFRLTKIGFGQKRKMLRNTIGALPEGDALLKRAGIDPQRRPQTLSIDEWVKLGECSVRG